MENLAIYYSTLIAIAASGILLFLSLLVADIAGIVAKKIPGSVVEADHEWFVFRSNRALGNLNESIAIFIIFALIGILGGSDAKWLAYFAWGYVVARISTT